MAVTYRILEGAFVKFISALKLDYQVPNTRYICYESDDSRYIQNEKIEIIQRFKQSECKISLKFDFSTTVTNKLYSVLITIRFT
jgi:hypothetical protein